MLLRISGKRFTAGAQFEDGKRVHCAPILKRSPTTLIAFLLYCGDRKWEVKAIPEDE